MTTGTGFFTGINPTASQESPEGTLADMVGSVENGIQHQPSTIVTMNSSEDVTGGTDHQAAHRHPNPSHTIDSQPLDPPSSPHGSTSEDHRDHSMAEEPSTLDSESYHPPTRDLDPPSHLGPIQERQIHLDHHFDESERVVIPLEDVDQPRSSVSEDDPIEKISYLEPQPNPIDLADLG